MLFLGFSKQLKTSIKQYATNEHLVILFLPRKKFHAKQIFGPSCKAIQHMLPLSLPDFGNNGAGSGLEFHFSEGKAILILKRALPFENLKVCGKLF